MELRRYLDPRVTWRDTSEIDKVRLYTGQSFVGIIALLGIFAVAESITEGKAVAVGAICICAVASILAVLRLPQIGGRSEGDIRALIAVAIVSAAVAGFTGSSAVPIWALLIVAIPVTSVISLRWTFAAALAVGVAAIPTRYGLLGGLAASGSLIFMAGAVKLSVWLLAIVTELDSSRHAAAQLSVAEERLRFSRDLHDVVGRALSAIAVKSELAATLSRRGDERAAEQMDEVRDLAQQSMSEARQLVRGYRSIDLGSEIRGASSLLGAAGITTDVVGDTTVVAPQFAEAAAWIVREGATNILRHSDATRCRIELAATHVRLSNDRPHSTTGTDGSGISGLRERLDAVGGTLDVTHNADEFALVAVFDSRVAS